jgi:hypothetical protein
MALLQLGIERLAAFETREWSNIMLHQNSVFHSILQQVQWDAFDRLVGEHQADARVRQLTTKSQFVALLYGQFARANSLREIVSGLQSHAPRLYHLGARPAQRSTLADANAGRPYQAFAGVLAYMIAMAGRGLRWRLADLIYLVDSTSRRLSTLSAEGARVSSQKIGAKLHMIYDPDADRPIHAVMIPANVNDITVAQTMPFAPGATYVFDLGYYDFGWWAKLDATGCRVVTRFKSNASFHVVDERPVAGGGAILSDRIGICQSGNVRGDGTRSRIRSVRSA